MPLPKPFKPTLRRMTSQEAKAREELLSRAFSKALFDAMLKEVADG